MMSIPRALRDELFKYRKHKRGSIDGSLPGVPYADYRRSRHYVSGLPHGPRGASHHDLYNWGVPGEYHPSLNAPAVDWSQYDPYEPSDVGHIPIHDHPRSPRGFINTSQEIPEFPVSSDELTLTERFLMAMGKRNEVEQRILEEPAFNINENTSEAIEQDSPQRPVEERNINELPSLEDLKDAFVKLVEVLPDDHPDLVNVRTAMRRVRDHGIAFSEMIDFDVAGAYPTGAEIEKDPFQLDPFCEAEQFFNQQMDLLEKSFDEQALELVGPQETELSETDPFESETMSDEPFMEEQTLEQIVQEENSSEAPAEGLMDHQMLLDEMAEEVSLAGAMVDPAGYDAGLIADEINQAIDAVTRQAMPQEEELDPFDPLHGPYMMGPFDQMQYMVDPFAMPGLYGPMGPDPMGPMPGP